MPKGQLRYLYLKSRWSWFFEDNDYNYSSEEYRNQKFYTMVGFSSFIHTHLVFVFGIP